ncbi:IS1380-Spn1 transposase [Streptococcus pneumoniae]|nr:IS1380-Spn1 transposase [Streptococcus pneumoniae]
MTVTKTNSNTYNLKVYIPKEIRPKMGIKGNHFVKRYKTRKEAKEAELEILTKIHQLENGEDILLSKTNDILFSEFFNNIWWDSYKAGQTTSTTRPPTQVTIDNTKTVFRKHILPMFGNYSINFLNQNKQVVLNLMTAKAEEYANFKVIRSYVNSIFDWAEELEYIESNRLSKTIKRIKATKKLKLQESKNEEDLYLSSEPQLFTPNLKTIQNPCLSLDPGWFLFSPNGCFLLDKKEFPLYGISVEKNTKRKETHMNSLPNHHFQNKSFYQLSFDGGHLTQYGGLIFFQELFSQLKLKERISKYLATNDQRRYCRYSDSDILVQFLFQLLTGYGTDYACKELSADAYFPKLLEGGQLASQPTLSRFLSRTDEETVHSLRCLNLELVEFFLQFHQLNQLIVDIDSTHFTTYGKQEGVAYNAHYRAHGYHPLYAFEGKTGYCFNAQLRPGNRYCSEEADSFITPVLERFNQLLFRMDSGFATPKLYDLIEKTGQYYLIKLKKNTVLSRLGDLSLPCPQDEDLTILPHSAYSETLYQAGSWSHKRRVCQFSERKEGNLFYDVISLVTNMTSGTS